jgi:23S rRNA (pseudouridine1915-N3)-methyltransferase
MNFYSPFSKSFSCGKLFGDSQEPFLKKVPARGMGQSPIFAILERSDRMLNVRVIAMGNLKESYLREAMAEYEKRLSGFCRFELHQLKEARLPDDPSPSEVTAALDEEAGRILALIPPRAYIVALCVEGKQFSSEELAQRLDGILTENSSVCLVIGSSHGLSEEVKAACKLRLSVSKLTFPHQMMRVMLLEILYRSFSILKGTRYHK